MRQSKRDEEGLGIKRMGDGGCGVGEGLRMGFVIQLKTLLKYWIIECLVFSNLVNFTV